MKDREIVVTIEELLERVRMLEVKLKSVQTVQEEQVTAYGSVSSDLQALSTRVDVIESNA